MRNHILLDVSSNTGSFFGKEAQPYVCHDELRKLLDGIVACHGNNRFFVLERNIIRAGQETREGALRYMAPNRVLVELA
jgi:hypothetical protein